MLVLERDWVTSRMILRGGNRLLFLADKVRDRRGRARYRRAAHERVGRRPVPRDRARGRSGVQPQQEAGAPPRAHARDGHRTRATGCSIRSSGAARPRRSRTRWGGAGSASRAARTSTTLCIPRLRARGRRNGRYGDHGNHGVGGRRRVWRLSLNEPSSPRSSRARLRRVRGTIRRRLRWRTPRASWSDAATPALPAAAADEAGATVVGWTESVRLERWDEAWRGLDALSDGEKKKPEIRYVRGRVALARGDHATAATLLEELEKGAAAALGRRRAPSRARRSSSRGRSRTRAEYFFRARRPSSQLKAAEAFEKAKRRGAARAWRSIA